MSKPKSPCRLNCLKRLGFLLQKSSKFLSFSFLPLLLNHYHISSFVEAHGTGTFRLVFIFPVVIIFEFLGTSLGDLIEIQGINDVFKASHTSDAPLVVGGS